MVGKANVAAGFRDFPGRRWLIVFLRAAHVVGLVGTGAWLLGGLPDAEHTFFLSTLLSSGIAMVAVDLWAAPGYLAEIAGGAVILKLLLLIWMVFDPAHRQALFWIVLVFSTIFAHAPAKLRHRRFLALGKMELPHHEHID